MRKNRLFFVFAMLFASVAVLTSCQKDETIGLNEALQLKSAQVGVSDSYTDDAWKDYCITCAGPYLVKSFTGTYTNNEVVTVSVHNTSTHIVYTFSGAWSSYNSGETTNPLLVALSPGWSAGNTVAQSFTIQRTNGGGGGGGNQVVVSTSYNLIGVCTTTSISVDQESTICVDETEVTVTGSVASCGAFEGGTIKLQEYFAGEWEDVPGASAGVTASNKEVEYSYTPDAAGTRTFRAVYSGGGNGYNASQSAPADVEAVDCSVNCDESFSVEDNGDGSYTFTYIPAVDIEGAELVFTFPQSALDTPLSGWAYNGQTMQGTVDLEACEVYSWTVSLSCKDLNNPQNKWTDFKVNGVSKKGDLDNIKCD